eukprot:scaffold12169_cov132-Cylindrotheca_fusiformis.AAC.5
MPQLSAADDLPDLSCANEPDDLAGIGAEQTCIESPDFEGERCFYTLIPDCAGEDSPLVYDIHGYGNCPAFHVTYSGWHTNAKENCFVLVYPVAISNPDIVQGPCWNLPGGLQLEDDGPTSTGCCCVKGNEQLTRFDEGPFLRQIAAVLSRDIPIQTSGNVTIDTKRIYMAGHSNGCIASLSIAAQYSDMVAAVGCHSGSGVSSFPATYNPRPVAMVHGKDDSIIGYNSSLALFTGIPGYNITLPLFSGLATHDIFSEMNGCTTFNETTLSNGENSTVTKLASTDCTNNASVVLYGLENVNHVPFLGDSPFNAVPVVVDTVQWMWDFVKQYSLEEDPDLVVTTFTNAPTPAPHPSGTLGDPHFRTWTNENFEYHGQCDLLLAADKNFADGLGLDVQIRTKLVRYWSYIKTAAIRIGKDVFEFQGDAFPEVSSYEPKYWFNFEYQGKLDTIGGFPIVMIRNSPQKTMFEIDLDSKYPGQKIIIGAYKEFVRVDFLNGSEESYGNVVGLLGNFKTGDTLSRDGEKLIHDFTELGHEWQVRPSDNMLFHDISDPQFPKRCIDPEDPQGERRRRLDETSLSEEKAEAACASVEDPIDRKNCVYDILATQDLDMVGAY